MLKKAGFEVLTDSKYLKSENLTVDGKFGTKSLAKAKTIKK